MTSWCFADNKISKIPADALAGLPNLEWLDLSKNKLDDFSLGLDVFQVRCSQENLISKCTETSHHLCLYLKNNGYDFCLNSNNILSNINLCDLLSVTTVSYQALWCRTVHA